MLLSLSARFTICGLADQRDCEKNFSGLLQRVLQQLNFKPTDVEHSSRLSASYIGRLLRDEKTNLTLKTIGILTNAQSGPVESFAAAPLRHTWVIMPPHSSS
jgi:hypothetical protein